MEKDPNSKIDSSENSFGFLDRLKDLDKDKIKRQITVFVLSLMITASAATMEGCTSTSNDIEPGVTVEDYIGGETEYEFSEEITEFIDQQGSRFGDLEKTVSTYYAEMAYEDQETYRMLNRTEAQRKIVNEYNLSMFSNEADYTSKGADGRLVDWLGFNVEIIDNIPSNNFSEYTADRLITDENMSTEIFNEWVLPNIENYISLAAKNPTGKERAVIEDCFKKRCTIARDNPQGNPSSPYQIISTNLINELNTIADKYGGNCNFVIKNISSTADNEDEGSILNFDNKTSNIFSKGKYLKVELNPTICIEVTTFNESGNKSTENVSESIQITLIQSNDGGIFIAAGSYN